MNGAMELFKVFASLVLDKSGFDKGIAEADESGKGLAHSLQDSIAKVQSFLKTSAIVGLAVKGAKSIWNLAQQTSAAGDRIDKQSQALGLSRKAYQEWDYILGQSGASIDSMGMSMRTLGAAISSGSAESSAAFSELGLSVAQLQNLSQEDQFEAVVKALQSMPDGAKKSQLAIQLLGRNAQSLMPLLNSSAESVEELRQRAYDLGLVMSDDDVDASVAFGDALDDLTKAGTAIKQKFGAQILPFLTKGLIAAANSLGRVTNAVQEAFKTGDWSNVFKTLTEEIGKVIPGAVDGIVTIITGIFENADKLVNLAVSIVTGLTNGIIGALPKLTEKLPGIIDTIWTALKELVPTIGNGIVDVLNSIFGTNIPHLDQIKWPTWEEVQKGAEDAWKLIQKGLSTVFKFIFGETEDGGIKWPTWDEVKDAAETAWRGIQEGLAGLVDTLGKFVFGETDDGAVKWPTWEEVGTAARDAWQGIVNGLASLLTDIGKFIFGEQDDTAAVDWPTWDEIKAAAEEAWRGIVKGLEGLGTAIGAFVFGVRDDGAVDWPTWDEVKAGAEDAWRGIKDGVAGLADSIGAFFFGKRDDGAVDWPTWDEVKQSAIDAWNGIKKGLADLAITLGEWVFGANSPEALSWIETINSWLDGSGLSEITLNFGATVAEWITTIKDWATNGINVVVRFFENLFGGGSTPSNPTSRSNAFGYNGIDDANLAAWLNEHVSPEVWNTQDTATQKYWMSQYQPQPHASGLNYVPFDGYRAILHRGEAVLNRSQGRDWRQNNAGLDLDRMYGTIAEAVASAVAEIQINMDGKAVGNAVTQQVSRNIYHQMVGRRTV